MQSSLMPDVVEKNRRNKKHKKIKPVTLWVCGRRGDWFRWRRYDNEEIANKVGEKLIRQLPNFWEIHVGEKPEGEKQC